MKRNLKRRTLGGPSCCIIWCMGATFSVSEEILRGLEITLGEQINDILVCIQHHAIVKDLYNHVYYLVVYIMFHKMNFGFIIEGLLLWNSRNICHTNNDILVMYDSVFRLSAV